MKKLLTCVMAVIVLSFVFVQAKNNTALAMTQDSEALTPPPPEFVQPFTIFDPGYKYLDRGGSHISDLGNQAVNIWGETYGTSNVDEIAVQLTLQQWTGSDWVDIYYGTTQTNTDSSYVYQAHNLSSVQKGYYYRVKSLHWIQNGSVYEGGTRYSASILIPL